MKFTVIVPARHASSRFPGKPLADIAGARQSIHLETYVWWKGEVCMRLAKALQEAAWATVQDYYRK